MIIPPGFLFRPTDELVVHYLRMKSMGQPLPCDAIIEREIYGVGDKAPWQIFSDEDPWEMCKTKDKNGYTLKIEATIYVFTTLIKASKNRIARIAGCGGWHAETALEQVVDDYGHVIGHKRMLCFQITNESEVVDKSVTKGHWIMHEYSLSGDGHDNTGHVLCRIKRDDSKSTKKSLKRGKNVGDDVIVPKPAKRIRTEFNQEQKMACDIAAAPATEGVPFSEDLLEVEKQGEYSPMLSDMVDGDFDELADSLLSLLEWERQQRLGLDFDAYGKNPWTPEVVPSGHVLASSAPAALDTSQDMVAGYFQEPLSFLDCDIAVAPPTECVPFSEELLEVEKQGEYSPMYSDMVDGDFEELVSLLKSEEQLSLGLDFDAYGNNPLNPEVVPLGHVLASSVPVALDTSQDMVAGYFEEPISLLGSEEQPSFDLDFDVFGYNPLTPEDTSQDYGEENLTYLLDQQDMPYQENLWSEEPNCFGVGLLI